MADSISGESSRIARVAAILGSTAIACVAFSIVGIQIGVLSPEVGFRVFGASAVLGGLLTLILGAVAIFVTRGGRDPIGRGRAWVGTALGAGLVAIVAAGAAPGGGLPAINDITTNLSEPPAFAAAARDPENADRDMAYPQEFVEQVQAAYPDLQPIGIEASGADALLQALQAADQLGWEIVATDEAAGTFEARDTSAVFRFVDDVAVRIRPTSDGSIIDVRSKSRVGRGDLGANAERIRAFSQIVGSAAAPAAVASE